MKKWFSYQTIAIMLFLFSSVDTQVYSIEKSSQSSHYFPMGEKAILLTGNANASLAQEVAECLDMPLAKAEIGRFADGEINIQILENVRNKEVFVVQSFCSTTTQSINDNLMELYLLVRTLKRASVESITAVIPYYGYARQDRKSSPRVPISAADVASMLELAGVDRIVTVDLHCGQIQGFFHNVPVDNLFASTVFVPYFAQIDSNNVVIVSPDAGGVERSKQFLEYIGRCGVDARMAIISKHRSKPGVVNTMNLIGDVQGADVIIVDDMCDTGGTLIKAAELLKENGANRVFAAITHPVFSGTALEKIGGSVIDEMVITNTIPLKGKAPDNIRCITIAPLLAETIRRIHYGESVSGLFKP